VAATQLITGVTIVIYLNAIAIRHDFDLFFLGEEGDNDSAKQCQGLLETDESILLIVLTYVPSRKVVQSIDLHD
jgi:hypothetical protein